MQSKSIGRQSRHDKCLDGCQYGGVKPGTPNRIVCRANIRTRFLAAFSIALLVAGVWGIDGVLGALGLAGLLLLLVARVLGTIQLMHVTVSIEAPKRVTAGMPYPLRVTVANRRRWLDVRSFDLDVALPGGADVAFESHWIPADSTMDFDGRATPSSRAVGDQAVIVLKSDFPMGLFDFNATTTLPFVMCVFPRSRVPAESLGHGVMLDSSPIEGATHGNLGGDLRGLRAWRGGDRPRQISWPATLRAIARGSGPIVRECDPPGYQPRRCLIVLHSFASGGALIHPERFDRVLEVATGWIERLRAFGIHTRITADFDAWKIRDVESKEEIIRCRERFAMARRCNSTEAHELEQALSRTNDCEQTVILLSDMPEAAWKDCIPRQVFAPVFSNIQKN